MMSKINIKKFKSKAQDMYNRAWGNTIGRLLAVFHDCYVAYEWDSFPSVSKCRCRKCGKYFAGSVIRNYKKLMPWDEKREDVMLRYFGEPTRTPEEYKRMIELGEIDA